MDENNKMGAKANGLLLQIKDFDFLFHVYILIDIFEVTRLLHQSLQSNTLDISTALKISQSTIQKLIEMKDDEEYYNNLFGSVTEFADDYNIQIPSSNKKRGRQSLADQHAKRPRTEIDPIIEYKDQFKEIINIFINHLSEKFQTDNYKPLIAIESILLAEKKI